MIRLKLKSRVFEAPVLKGLTGKGILKFDLTGMRFCLEYTKLAGEVKEKGGMQSLEPVPHNLELVRK
jgi:hypothetical protein